MATGELISGSATASSMVSPALVRNVLSAWLGAVGAVPSVPSGARYVFGICVRTVSMIFFSNPIANFCGLS